MQRALLIPGPPNAPRVIRVRAGGAGSSGGALLGGPGSPGLRTGKPYSEAGPAGVQGQISYAGSERTDCIARPAGQGPGGRRGSSGPFGAAGWGWGSRAGLGGLRRGAGAPMIGPARVDEPGDERPVLRLGEERARAFAKPGLSPTPVSFVAAAGLRHDLERSGSPPRSQHDPPRARSAQEAGARFPTCPAARTRGPGAGPGWWRSQ